MNAGSFLSVCVIVCLFLSSQSLRIKQCDNEKITLQTNQENTIECDEIQSEDTIVAWKIAGHGVERTLAECGPGDKCWIANNDVVATVFWKPSYVTLFLRGNATLNNKTLTCESQILENQKGSTRTSCDIIVTGPTTGTVINSPQDTNPTDAPVEAIVGGAVAAFVVVIVIVVVVIIVRRKRRREHSGKDASHEHQVHYNPENGTGVDVDTSQNADGDTSAGPPEFGIYAFPGGDEPATIPDNTPAAEEDDVGMYAAPKQDVYAAVDKSTQKKNKPATLDHLDTSQAAAVGDEYAVVNKASKKTDASNSTGLSEVHIPEDNDTSAAPAPYIYAQVDKTARNAKPAVSVPSTPEEEGATYAQVQKPKKK